MYNANASLSHIDCNSVIITLIISDSTMFYAYGVISRQFSPDQESFTGLIAGAAFHPYRLTPNHPP